MKNSNKTLKILALFLSLHIFTFAMEEETQTPHDAQIKTITLKELAKMEHLTRQGKLPLTVCKVETDFTGLHEQFRKLQEKTLFEEEEEEEEEDDDDDKEFKNLEARFKALQQKSPRKREEEEDDDDNDDKTCFGINSLLVRVKDNTVEHYKQRIFQPDWRWHTLNAEHGKQILMRVMAEMSTEWAKKQINKHAQENKNKNIVEKWKRNFYNSGNTGEAETAFHLTQAGRHKIMYVAL
ncbi:hypothetical protein ACFLY6_00465 [Candidatus Dependentiae bacterium]